MTSISKKQLDDILGLIENNAAINLISPPGSGKSTFIVEQIFKEKVSIYIVEQTITAVNGLYDRMKPILKSKLGFAANMIVQYENTFLHKCNEIINGKIDPRLITNVSSMNKTPVVYMTDGHIEHFFRNIVKYVIIMIQNNIKAEKIDVRFCDILMIDEAHTGGINTESVMAMWKYLYNLGVVVPKLLLASATLDVELTLFSSFPSYVIETETHPVEIKYLTESYDNLNNINSFEYYMKLAEVIMTTHYNDSRYLEPDQTMGDTWLAFCAGSYEVEKTCEYLDSYKDNRLIIVPIYAELTQEDKNKIFEPTPQCIRKIIVATNLAETAITINNLSGVFDSLCEKLTETSESGGTKLDLVFISKASAKQRAGRTGRTCPGFCYRMCNEDFYNTLPEQRRSELHRIPLHNLIIKLYDLKIEPIKMFPILNKNKINISLKLLKNLKMVNQTKVLENGSFATKLPFSPRNSNLLFDWISLGYNIFPCLSLVALLDCYSTGYFYIPKLSGNFTVDQLNDYNTIWFSQYNHQEDMGILLNLWFKFLKKHRDYEKIKYREILEYSNDNKLNNKTFALFITTMKQATTILKNGFGFNVTTSPFDINEVIREIKPLLINSYSDLIIQRGALGDYMNSNKVVFKPKSGKILTECEVALVTFGIQKFNSVIISTPIDRNLVRSYF